MPILPNDSAISVRITPGRIPIPIHMKVLRKTNPRSSYRPSGHNPENCIAVQTKLQEKSGSSNLFVPSILLSNVMSLAPKIDELREVSKQIDVDLICITESWLQNHIHDNVVEISGYNIVRRDRYQGEHGGVCVYVKNVIKYDILSELVNNEFEAIWLKLRPLRLLRGMSCIILCKLYHPPKANDQDLINYLYETLTTVEARFTNCGVIILGDFNKLNLSRLKNSFKLCQIVKFPTRGSSRLDLVLTNMKQFYDDPIKRPPFGLSDHLSVEVQPLKRPINQRAKFYTFSRDLRHTKRLIMRKYLEEVDIKSLIDTQNSCKTKVEMFESIINYGLDTLLPLKSKLNVFNDPPWISHSLRKLIQRRQAALARGDESLFKSLRNQVNRERKSCRGKFYSSKIE